MSLISRATCWRLYGCFASKGVLISRASTFFKRFCIVFRMRLFFLIGLLLHVFLWCRKLFWRALVEGLPLHLCLPSFCFILPLLHPSLFVDILSSFSWTSDLLSKDGPTKESRGWECFLSVCILFPRETHSVIVLRRKLASSLYFFLNSTVIALVVEKKSD